MVITKKGERAIYCLGIGLCLGFILFRYLDTAATHLDDLSHALAFQDSKQKISLMGMGVNLFLNRYVGVLETRTYGLALLIEYLLWLTFGRSPILVHGFIALVHLMSGIALFWAIKSVERNVNLRFMLALAWVASPFILPTAKTLHHFLYVMGPYYALILWFGVVLNAEHVKVLPGAALLTCAWLLGEASIGVASVSVTVIFLKLIQKGRKRDATAVAKQAGISLLLLVGYVAYQKAFVFQSAYRMKTVMPDSLSSAILRVKWVIFGVLQSFLAFLGLDHTDPELGGQCVSAGLHYVGSAVMMVSALVGAVCCIGLWRPSYLEEACEKHYSLAIAAISISLSTTMVYVLWTMATGSLPFTPRYGPPVFTVALITIPIALRALAPKWAQIVIPLVAATSLSFSVGLCDAYYSKVYKPMRMKSSQLMSARQAGAESLLISHVTPGGSDVAFVDNLWPGIGGAYDHFAPDPYKGFWITRLYAFAVLDYGFVGFDYRKVNASYVAIRYNDVWRTFRKDKVVVAGTDSSQWPVANMPWKIYGNFLTYEGAISNGVQNRAATAIKK